MPLHYSHATFGSISVTDGGIKKKDTTYLHYVQPVDYSRQAMRQHDLSTEVLRIY